MEIVNRPDIRGPEEAAAYIAKCVRSCDIWEPVTATCKTGTCAGCERVDLFAGRL